MLTKNGINPQIFAVASDVGLFSESTIRASFIRILGFFRVNLTIKVLSNRFTLFFLMSSQLVHIVYNKSYNFTSRFSRIWFQKSFQIALP